MKHHRDWGESAALLVCVALFVGLRNRYTIGPPQLTWALGLIVALIFALSVIATIVGEGRPNRRRVMAVAMLVLTTGVALSLYKVVYLVVYRAGTVDGIRLLETSLLIWVTNVVVFAMIYHMIGEAEFAFPRSPEQPPDQPMNFLDYIFLSFTTATAFSPTDTSPLSTRARMCMMFESMISLVAIAVAAARAINILPS